MSEKNEKIAAALASSAGVAAEAIKIHSTNFKDSIKRTLIMLEDLEKLQGIHLDGLHCNLARVSQLSCLISSYVGEYTAYREVEKLFSDNSTKSTPAAPIIPAAPAPE